MVCTGWKIKSHNRIVTNRGALIIRIMDLEDAIEEAEEKGWSETLVFHEIFNVLRKEEIDTDGKVLSGVYAYGFICPAAVLELDV